MVLDKSAADTEDLLLFVDKLFDSVNGAAVSSAGGKSLRVAITERTQHISLRNESIAVFSSIKFYQNSTKSLKTPQFMNCEEGNSECLNTFKFFLGAESGGISETAVTLQLVKLQ
ncbi:hypothetical protein QE152_g5002 [Popillia japonica]|uniref:Uncharacterized protein n=1 Tax=Popillia japonica TaxID=7064 RepID=A0AAW1MYJ0_POPJA